MRKNRTESAIDAFDLRLLASLQQSGRMTYDSLAKRVGLSSTACQRRLKRLREIGVIEGEVTVISPKRIGRSLIMIVEVTLERERTDIIDRFKRTICETPEVMQAWMKSRSRISSTRP